MSPMAKEEARAAFYVTLALLGLTGCASTQPVIEVAHAARDIVVVAEPCLVDLHAADLAACQDDSKCIATVGKHWGPIMLALDVLHDGWCSLAPDAEGC